MRRSMVLGRVAFTVAATLAAQAAAAADPLLRTDTGWHLGASYSLGAIGRQIGAGTVPIANDVVRGTVLGMMPGLLKELGDSRANGNRFSGRDMAANFAGAFVGAAFGDRVFIVPTGLGDGRADGVIVGVYRSF
jgi:uncharacterized protein YfiM (DUF2279 family)